MWAIITELILTNPKPHEVLHTFSVTNKGYFMYFFYRFGKQFQRFSLKLGKPLELQMRSQNEARDEGFLVLLWFQLDGINFVRTY
jgi:hypothetical protein